MVYDTSYDNPNYVGTQDVGRVKRSHYLREIIDPLGRVGARTEYDETGRLKQIFDVNGKAVEMTYDLSNDKQVVKDKLGYETTYIYDDRGNVLREIDSQGSVTSRSYDANNNILTETDADGVTMTYTYDDQNNLLTVKDEDGNATWMSYDGRGHLTSTTSPTGLTVKAKYDDRGNLIESIDTDGLKSSYSYSSKGQLRFQTAPDGQVTEYDYDRLGNPIKMVDSRGNVTTSVYDRNGRMSTASSTFLVNGQSYTLGTEYVYDKEGRTTESRNSRGHVQKMSYDNLGRATSTTDAFGNVTSFRHDIQDASIGTSIGLVNGNRSVITRVDEVILPDNTPDNSTDNSKVIRKYDQANQLVAEISQTGLETRYVYDSLGRLIETIVPDLTVNDWTDNPRLKREYTAGSRLKGKTDIFGNWERYAYNDLGQMTSVRDVLNNLTAYTYTDGGQISTVTDPRNRKTQNLYDANGRVKETQFFDNTKSSWTYDDLGRVKSATNGLNQTTTYEYDQYSQVNAVINALNEKTKFEYNDRRQLVQVTDGLGQSTRYKYDQFANQTETSFQNGDKVSMTYDGFDRMTSTTDERQFTTQYRYNNLSQLVEIEQPNSAKTNYSYDTLGRMVGVKDANQRSTTFEYDAFDRVVASQQPMGQRNQTVYDKYGQVKSTTDFNQDTINYSYDGYGRLSQKSFTDSRLSTVTYGYENVMSHLTTVTDGRGVTRYDYDNYDRLFKVTNPDSQSVQYGYDVLDNVTSVKTKAGTTDYGYDKLNRLDLVKDGSKVLADYDYDAAGNLIRTKFANSSTEIRTYDGRNRLKSMTSKNVVGTTFSGFTYELDAAGNRTKVTENNGRVADYQYDSLNRLTQEQVTDSRLGNQTTGYGYDLVGNRSTKTDTIDGTTTYLYDGNDRLLSASNGSQSTQFTYDNNGSMKTRNDGTSTVTYGWANDGENRLLSASDGVNQTQFIYDAFGERVATIDNGTRTNYLSAPIWNLPEVLMEYDNAGNIKADYTHGIGVVRSRRDTREVYHHTDGLGSTIALTDTVGLVTDRYTYDAYGGTVDHQGTFGNSFQFAGEQRDSSTGLDYLRARYYDSSLGRFVSADPFSGFMNDPMSLHNYQYANSNPTRYTDPTGYMSLGELSVVTSILGSIGLSAAYVGQKYVLNGGLSSDDVLTMSDAWFAGFAHGATGGFYSEARRLGGSEIRNDDDGAFLWQMGVITGVAASFGVGLKLPSLTTAQMGSWGKWVALGWGAVAASGMKQGLDGLTDGKWEWTDAVNLLALIPLAQPIRGGASTSIGTMRQASRVNAGGGADDAMRASKNVRVNMGAGIPIRERLTEYLTRLQGSPRAGSAEEALDQVRRTLIEVEDELSGIPMSNPPPPPNMPDGRMYPPLDDYTKRLPDGSIQARSRGHNVDIGPDGSIKVTDRKTGKIEVDKPGSGQ